MTQPDQGPTVCEQAPEEGTCGLWVRLPYDDGPRVHICTGDHGETERHECGCGLRRRASLHELALGDAVDKIHIEIDETGTLIRQATAQEGSA